MLQYDRTEYSGKGIARVFHVCGADSPVYGELVAKYGADNVKRSATGRGITDALAMCMHDRGDTILVWPGTYTPTATITVNKRCVTIKGAIEDNPSATIITATTSGVCAFTFSSAGDYSSLRNMTILMDITGPTDAIIVAADCPGVTIDSVIIPNGDNTGALVGIDAESDYLTVKNCRMFGLKFPIQSLGTMCRFINNHLVNNIASAVGIDMQDGDYHLVERNVLDVLDGTSTEATKIGTSAKCNQVTFKENSYNKACDVFITNGNSSTLGQYGDIKSDVTTSVWATTT